MDTHKTIEFSPEMKMRAVEIAERMSYWQSNPGGGYLPKSFNHLRATADQILEYVYGVEQATTNGLISRLKAALCENPS